jgi:hypothetical protein
MKLFKKKTAKSGYCNISEPISDLDPKRISAIKSRHVSELDPKVISAIKAQHLEASKAAQSQQGGDKDGTDVTISLTPSPSQSSKSTPQSKIVITTIQDSPANADAAAAPLDSQSNGGKTKYKSPLSSKRLFAGGKAAASSSPSTTTATVTSTPTSLNPSKANMNAGGQDTRTSTAATVTIVTTTTMPSSTKPIPSGSMVNDASFDSPIMGSSIAADGGGTTTVATPFTKPPIVPKTPDTFFQGRNRKRLEHLDSEVDTQMPVHYFENMAHGITIHNEHYNDDNDNDDDMEPVPNRSSGERETGTNVSSLPRDATSFLTWQPKSSKKTFMESPQQQQQQKQQQQQQKKQLPVHHATPTNGSPLLFQRKDSTSSDLDKSFSPDIISVHSDITDPSFHSHSNHRKSSRRSWHLRIRDGFRDTCRQHDLKSPMSFLEMILDSICSGPRSS